jgi:hypothetical protein
MTCLFTRNSATSRFQAYSSTKPLPSSRNPNHSERTQSSQHMQKEPQKQSRWYSKLLRQVKKTTPRNKIFITNIFKEYKIIYLTRPNEFSTSNRPISSKEPSEILALERLVPTEFYLLLGRTHPTRSHCFLQRKDAVHPRLVSAAQDHRTTRTG